ncbi:hypothetical protein E2320_000501 [Naja naja]|nr:hypothetical protein E2320_000501 [Naja naja]
MRTHMAIWHQLHNSTGQERYRSTKCKAASGNTKATGCVKSQTLIGGDVPMFCKEGWPKPRFFSPSTKI